MICNHGVAGSSPAAGTILLKDIKIHQFSVILSEKYLNSHYLLLCLFCRGGFFLIEKIQQNHSFLVRDY